MDTHGGEEKMKKKPVANSQVTRVSLSKKECENNKGTGKAMPPRISVRMGGR